MSSVLFGGGGGVSTCFMESVGSKEYICIYKKGIIGERSELTVSSCQSRFVGRVCIGRNFEISLRRHGIVYGMRVVHKNERSAHALIFLAYTKSRIHASWLIAVAVQRKTA